MFLLLTRIFLLIPPCSYYNDQKATEKSIDSFGWFDTGDLGYINPATGDLFICGRAKDTIVLSNGENVEPNPIEDTLIGCKLIVSTLLLNLQLTIQLKFDFANPSWIICIDRTKYW